MACATLSLTPGDDGDGLPQGDDIHEYPTVEFALY